MITMCAPTPRALLRRRGSGWPATALLELGEHAALEQPRRHVDLDVELADLGLEVGVGDRLERVAFAMAGSPASSVRFSSISSPNERRSESKRDSRSIRANTSRQVRTFWRYR